MRYVLAYIIIGLVVATTRLFQLKGDQREFVEWHEIVWEVAVWPVTLVLVACGKM